MRESLDSHGSHLILEITFSSAHICRMLILVKTSDFAGVLDLTPRTEGVAKGSKYVK